MPDVSDTIQTAATDGVQRASADGRSVDGVPLPDLIEADKYLRGLAAVTDPAATGGPKSGWRGVRMGRAVPPGASPT